MPTLDRRHFLQLSAAGLMTPFTLVDAEAGNGTFRIDRRRRPDSVFGLSVASGDPTPSGVVLWTRVDPEDWRRSGKLGFQVANDRRFEDIVVQGEARGRDFDASRDHTVKIDLDGQLAPGRRYFYRFVWRRTSSRIGRCRTLPAAGGPLDSLRLGVLTCQDYTNGYYGALAHLAREQVDFVIHLGDFIYETSGDPRFQSLPFEDREVVLPSGGRVALDLEDYRFLYRTYRSDRFLQRCMERHTWIVVWDDHEAANDAYWDYDRDTLGAPDHPYTLDPDRAADGVLLLRQLKRDANRAWTEYVPARPQLIEDAASPQDQLTIYRSFAFGDLVDLFMTDQRTYRTEHPCGEGDLGERYVTPGCEAQDDPARFMLGAEQRSWLVGGMTGSTALWKVWGNEVFQGALRFGLPGVGTLFFNLDAWDGYEFERRTIMSDLRDVENLIVLTGDLHSYIASYLLEDYDLGPDLLTNRVGVELMTPAVTSANLKELVTSQSPDSPFGQALNDVPATLLTEAAVRANNPHIYFFNSDFWGYSVVGFDRAFCTYTAYRVDKAENSGRAEKRLLRRLQVPVGEPLILEGDPVL